MRARQDGFSLIEVLVAIIVIGFVALSVAPMFMIASRSNKSAAHVGQCSALAMERMEILRRTNSGSLAVGGSLTTNTAGYVDTTQADFVVRWRITAAVDPAAGKQIDVRSISLHPSMGPDKQVTFSSLRVP